MCWLYWLFVCDSRKYYLNVKNHFLPLLNVHDKSSMFMRLIFGFKSQIWPLLFSSEKHRESQKVGHKKCLYTVCQILRISLDSDADTEIVIQNCTMILEQLLVTDTRDCSKKDANMSKHTDAEDISVSQI